MSTRNPFQPPNAPLADAEPSKALLATLIAVNVAFAIHGSVMLFNIVSGIAEHGMDKYFWEPLLLAIARVSLPIAGVALLAQRMPSAKWLSYGQLVLWVAVFLLYARVHVPQAFAATKVPSGSFSQAELSRQVLVLAAVTLAVAAALALGTAKYFHRPKGNA